MNTEKMKQIREILQSLKTIGEQGMSPSFADWNTFHDKVAQRAADALDLLDELLERNQ